MMFFKGLAMLFTDELSCVQDELCGIRVRADLYRDLTAEEAYWADYNAYCAQFDNDEGFEVPFALMCWSDGGYTDLDDDGNEIWVRDGWPEWFVSSYHRTLKGAEIAAAYHEREFNAQNVRIEERVWVEGYQKRYIRIED